MTSVVFPKQLIHLPIWKDCDPHSVKTSIDQDASLCDSHSVLFTR